MKNFNAGISTMMNENRSIHKYAQIKPFFSRNGENIILILLILCAVLSILYKIYEINGNKLALLNINDKNKISVTENDKNVDNYVNNVPADGSRENSVSDSPGQINAKPLFILGEKDGKIALYDSGKNEALQTYDVYISTLPEYDRKALAAGIYIYDLKELDSLIEDFTS